MTGKANFVIFTIIFMHSILVNGDSIEKDNSIFIKGGLIFEKGTELPVTINPPSVILTKFVNFTILDKASKLAGKYTNIYSEFCERLNTDLYDQDKEIRKKKFFVSEKVLDTRKLMQYCSSHEGQLPEIRNQNDLFDVIQIAKSNKIDRILAGIVVDTKLNQWVYISDRENINTYDAIFQKAYTFREPIRSGIFERDKILTEEAERGLILYHLYNDTIRIKVYPNRDDWSSKGICQLSNLPRFENIEQTLLLKMTAHA